MNALIVNCSGLGDGVIEIPFLENLGTAASRIRYFHTEGLLFRDARLLEALHMPGYVGNVSAEWRKFYEADWDSILAFIEAENIEFIINFRHIGPSYDSGYFKFRELKGAGLTFLNYDFDGGRLPLVNIREKIDRMLRSYGLIDEVLGRHCLRRLVPSGEHPVSRRIGINMHTGSVFKRWSMRKWRILCSELLRRGYRLVILSGYSVEEQALSAELFRDIERERVGKAILVPSSDFLVVLKQLSRTECLVSVDSWPVHAATGIGVKTIGLYIVSSSIMWGGEAPFAFPVESSHLRRCVKFDNVLGICRNGYVNCPLIEAEGDGIEVGDVLELVRRCVSIW